MSLVFNGDFFVVALFVMLKCKSAFENVLLDYILRICVTKDVWFASNLDRICALELSASDEGCGQDVVGGRRLRDLHVGIRDEFEGDR